MKKKYETPRKKEKRMEQIEEKGKGIASIVACRDGG